MYTYMILVGISLVLSSTSFILGGIGQEVTRRLSLGFLGVGLVFLGIGLVPLVQEDILTDYPVGILRTRRVLCTSHKSPNLNVKGPIEIPAL
jgi:hypothetical protein